MKNKSLKIFLAFSLLTAMSCNDQLDINRDPDALAPEQVPLKAELPTTETGMAGISGSALAIAGGFWSQYFTQSSTANQYKTIDNYSIGTSDLNGVWGASYDALLDARNIKKNAVAKGNWKYYLIASTLEAYQFQILADSYGNIPYTQALDSSILNPKYDDPSVVYDGLVSDLKFALSKDLSTSSITEVPGTDDFIFSGDMTKWRKFANTMLLKLYLRQTEVRPSVAQAGIQQLLSSGAIFLTEDAAITQFIDEANKSNPLYESDRRQLNVGTNLRASTTLYSYLQTNSDSRASFYYNSGISQNQGDYSFGPQNAAVIKLKATDPYYFISKAESYFMQAEADLRYNGGANAKTFYDLGVKAAFSRWGLDGSSYVASGGAYAYPGTTLANNLKAIITQKWINYFPENGFEGFFEQNRTGIPGISSVYQTSPSYVSGLFVYSLNGVTGGKFPKRLVYPQTESQTNSSFPGLQPITTPVWYDAN